MRSCLCSCKNVSLPKPPARVAPNFNRWYELLLNCSLRSYVTQAENREPRSFCEERNAIESFEQLLKSGRAPSVYVILTALKACSNLKDVQTGNKIRSYLRGSGSDRDVNVGNTLVHMFSKCGDMVQARCVFDELPQRSVVSWNAVIFGYAENGQAEEALKLFSRMRDEGFEPNEVTYVAALRACAVGASKDANNQAEEKLAKLGYLEKGEAIHSQLKLYRYENKVKVATSLVDMYAKCGSMSEARKVFDNMREHSLVSWNSLLFGYAENGNGETALQLFHTMQREGFKPDARTFVAALKACSSCAEGDDKGTRLDGRLVKLVWLDKGMSIHAELRGEDRSNTIVSNSLIHMYTRCGALVDARRVFDSMSQHSVITWNSVIFGYAEGGEGEVALHLLACMQQGRGFPPTAVTYVGALKACVDIADRNKGKQQWCLEQGRGIHSQATIYEADMRLSSTLVDMYAKCGSMGEACRVFNRMQSHDVVAWNALILGYAEAGQCVAALRSFATMEQEGHTPDAVTFISVLKACAGLARIDIGREVHAEVRIQGQVNQVNVVNSLVDFYGKCGAMRDAQEVFDRTVVERDLVTWNSLMSGYAHQGDTDQVFEVFERMRGARVRPNDITYLCLLKACSHAGLVDKGRECFDLMSKERSGEASPGVEHYTCMVDMLGRASHLEEAVKMVREMPFEADKTIWTTVLSSSRKWKNVEIAKLAFEAISRLEHQDSGPYVLMSDTLKQCFV